MRPAFYDPYDYENPSDEELDELENSMDEYDIETNSYDEYDDSLDLEPDIDMITEWDHVEHSSLEHYEYEPLDYDFMEF